MSPSELPRIPWPVRGDWQTKLTEFGALLVQNVPLDADNDSLHAMGAELGETSVRAIDPQLAETGGIQRVEACATPIRDRFGKPLLSASNAEFALHTDESFFDNPARYVLLHCWRASDDGATLLADTHKLVAQVDRIEWLAWTQLRLPYPCGDVCSIDSRGVTRFNRAECEQYPLTANQQHWLQRFSATLQRIMIEFVLRPGELLITDNHRVLHGRRAFAAISGRMLKRLRIR